MPTIARALATRSTAKIASSVLRSKLEDMTSRSGLDTAMNLQKSDQDDALVPSTHEIFDVATALMWQNTQKHVKKSGAARHLKPLSSAERPWREDADDLLESNVCEEAMLESDLASSEDDAILSLDGDESIDYDLLSDGDGVSTDMLSDLDGDDENDLLDEAAFCLDQGTTRFVWPTSFGNPTWPSGDGDSDSLLSECIEDFDMLGSASEAIWTHTVDMHKEMML
jgi:hypothetical protein